jgi:predicted nucleic acid-binding Zn ribbon protein
MEQRLLSLAYVPRNCLACGKHIPRWENGKQTTRKFCGSQCSAWYGRTHPKTRPEGHGETPVRGHGETPVRGECAPRSVEAKNVPLPQALLEPVGHQVGRSGHGQAPGPEYHPCRACGRTVRMTLEFCSDRCRDYVPLGPRKAGGETRRDAGPEWWIIAGPVPYCDGCGLAIGPDRQGLLLPRRMGDGGLRCTDCVPLRHPKGARKTEAALEMVEN